MGVAWPATGRTPDGGSSIGRVPREVLIDALGNTVIASLAYKGQALRARDYTTMFTTAGIVTDLELAAEQGDANGVAMPITAGVLDQFGEALVASYGADDFLSVFRVQRAKSSLPVDPYPSR
jgi:3-hydroxyisobutyrate dehydrogenase-like beta-hydroxyacid dehydrogenase